ncbi:MAG: Putative transmembrane protein [uncultured Paraburkholderia sp.]|nr:MAG: Putative transmembrane protein [uncultured Paraburkholderia sp.]CAH2913220.1 MAG: Putative transmembrane protein [uncultured Paraburkholderia sp.]
MTTHGAATAAGSATSTATPVPRKTGAALGATLALIALIVLSIAWEWWLAPLRPGGSALVLKAVPLLLVLPGVWRRKLHTLQWASMLILLYFAEGIVRGWSDSGLSARLGWLETALAVVFFACTLAYVAPFKRAAKQAAKQAKAEEKAVASAEASRQTPAQSQGPRGDV